MITVVGAGIAGAACARVLTEAGLPVRVVERGRAPGGRLAAPELHGRRVDLGASYLTASDPVFAGLVADWERRGLLTPWTRVFDVHSEKGFYQTGEGQTRWRAPTGLRSLARDLLDGLPLELEQPVTAADVIGLSGLGESAGRAGASAGCDIRGNTDDVVVLAMPDPQARRLLEPDGPHAGLRATLDVEYDPVIAVAAEWPEREWAFADGVFVNHHPVLTFLADDGSRRGDGAPVLVAHTTPAFAADHLTGSLDDLAAAQAPVIAAVTELLSLSAAPLWAHAHRWTTAKPASAHAESYAWSRPAWSGPARPGRGGIGVAGDAWCPSGSPRVESAWLSGDALGRRIVTELAIQ